VVDLPEPGAPSSRISLVRRIHGIPCYTPETDATIDKQDSLAHQMAPFLHSASTMTRSVRGMERSIHAGSSTRHRPGHLAHWRYPELAVQPGLGLLPWRRPGAHSDYRAHPLPDRSDLARAYSNRLAPCTP